MINDSRIISIGIHVLKRGGQRRFVGQCALYTGQFATKLIGA